MAMTDEEHDKLIENEKEHDGEQALAIRIFGKALACRLKSDEGVVVHIPARDNDEEHFACVVARDDEMGTIKIIPDPMYLDIADGTPVWLHDSKEEADAANEKQRKTELH